MLHGEKGPSAVVQIAQLLLVQLQHHMLVGKALKSHLSVQSSSFHPRSLSACMVLWVFLPEDWLSLKL